MSDKLSWRAPLVTAICMATAAGISNSPLGGGFRSALVLGVTTLAVGVSLVQTMGLRRRVPRHSGDHPGSACLLRGRRAGVDGGVGVPRGSGVAMRNVRGGAWTCGSRCDACRRVRGPRVRACLGAVSELSRSVARPGGDVEAGRRLPADPLCHRLRRSTDYPARLPNQSAPAGIARARRGV